MRLNFKVGALSMVALGSLALSLSLSVARAQTTSTSVQGTPQVHPARTTPVANPLSGPTKYTEVSKKLDRQIEIPNMPAYPGRTQYQGGHIVEVPGANTYTMTFLATDPPSRVREWYIQALSGYNWKQTIHPTPNQVSGMTADGSGLTVSFTDSKVQPYKSQVMVTYHERVKQK